MTGDAMTDDWKARAALARRERLGAWIGSPALIVAGMALVAWGGSMPDSGAIGWIALAAGIVACIGGTALGTAIYMRLVDEQERNANLWGCYVGMTAYLVLYAVRLLVVATTHVAPYGHDAIFLMVMAVVMGVFLRLRFR